MIREMYQRREHQLSTINSRDRTAIINVTQSSLIHTGQLAHHSNKHIFR